MALINVFRPNYIGRVTSATYKHRGWHVQFEFSIYESEHSPEPVHTLYYQITSPKLHKQKVDLINVKNLQQIKPEEGMVIHLDISFSDDLFNSELGFYRNRFIKYTHGKWEHISEPSEFYLIDQGVYKLIGSDVTKISDYNQITEYDKYFSLTSLNGQDTNLIKCIYQYLKTLPEWENAKDY